MRTLLVLLLSAACCFAQPSQMLQRAIATQAGWKNPGGGGALSPAFGGEIITRFVEQNDTVTHNLTTTTTVSSGNGNRIVVCIMLNGTDTVPSITDSAGNTYSLDASCTNYSSPVIWIFSAPVTSTLASGGTISAHYTSAAWAWQEYAVFYVTGTTSKDVSAYNFTYGTSISVPGTTTANAVAIGVLQPETTSITYSGSWTQVGSRSVHFGLYYLDSVLSAGSQNPGGTASGANSWMMLWVAYK